jgi:2-dehydropantoate 2-reductase
MKAMSHDDGSGVRTIWVFGVGGVGGYFGGKIAFEVAHKGITDRHVFFIARGSHLEEIRKHGLVLNTTAQGRIVCRPDYATDQVEELPPPDLCLLCTKSYDVPEAARALSMKVKRETVVLPLLNGIDICERIRSVLHGGVVLPACVYVGTHIETPGVVTQQGGDGIILCGADPEFPDFDSAGLSAFFRQSGITFQWQENPYSAIWEKFIFIASFGLVTAASGKTLGGVAEDERLRALARGIMIEIVSLAEKKKIPLPEGIVERTLERPKNFPFEAKTSYQRDLETKGDRNEGDLFGGTILRLGKALGVETPVTRSVYDDILKGL